MFNASMVVNKLLIKLEKGVPLEEAQKDIENLTQESDCDTAFVMDSEENFLMRIDTTELDFRALMSRGSYGKRSPRSGAMMADAIRNN